MAKSKSGGTRAYIRGKVGADVYSIGKTAKGKKQQVVRSLAETVANPQTQAQMRGRMIMSTIMQTVAALSPIIDHSFDNVNGRQPNISEFISRNYALVKADVAAHPASSNKFGLNKYQEKGAKAGAYIVSAGAIPVPSALTFSAEASMATIALGAAHLTVGELKAALGLEGGDYITLVGLGYNDLSQPVLAYARYYLSDSLADSTAISASNIASVFTVDSNYDNAASVNAESGAINLSLNNASGCLGVILSKKTANGWEHSNGTLQTSGTLNYTANVALPTYPTGGADFLNGGDIFG